MLQFILFTAVIIILVSCYLFITKVKIKKYYTQNSKIQKTFVKQLVTAADLNFETNDKKVDSMIKTPLVAMKPNYKSNTLILNFKKSTAYQRLNSAYLRLDVIPPRTNKTIQLFNQGKIKAPSVQSPNVKAERNHFELLDLWKMQNDISRKEVDSRLQIKDIEIDSLKSELRHVNSRIHFMQRDFSSELRKLEQRLKDKESEKKILELQIINVDQSHIVKKRRYKNEIETLKKDKKHLETEIEIFREEKEAENLKSKEIEKNHLEEMMKMYNINNKLKITEEFYKEVMQEDHLSLKKEIECLQNDKEAREEEFQKQTYVLNSQNAQLRGIIAKMGKKIEDRANDLEYMKERELSLEKEVVRLSNYIDGLQKEMADNNTRSESVIISLRKEIQGKNDDIEALKCSMVSHDNSYNISNGSRVRNSNTSGFGNLDENLSFRKTKSETNLNADSITNQLDHKLRSSRDFFSKKDAIIEDLTNTQISELIIEDKRLEDEGVQSSLERITTSGFFYEDAAENNSCDNSSNNLKQIFYKSEDVVDSMEQLYSANDSNYQRSSSIGLSENMMEYDKLVGDYEEKFNTFQMHDKFIKKKDEDACDLTDSLRIENQTLRSQLEEYRDCLEKTESILEAIQTSVDQETIKWRVTNQSSNICCCQSAVSINVKETEKSNKEDRI